MTTHSPRVRNALRRVFAEHERKSAIFWRKDDD